MDDELVDVDEEILITANHNRDLIGTQQMITITDDDAAPVVTTTSPLLVEENETAVATLMATDSDDRLEDLEWEIVGGADRSKFTLTSDGELAFKAAKDYENPGRRQPRRGLPDHGASERRGQSGGGGLHGQASGCG